MDNLKYWHISINSSLLWRMLSVLNSFSHACLVRAHSLPIIIHILRWLQLDLYPFTERGIHNPAPISENFSDARPSRDAQLNPGPPALYFYIGHTGRFTFTQVMFLAQSHAEFGMVWEHLREFYIQTSNKFVEFRYEISYLRALVHVFSSHEL